MSQELGNNTVEMACLCSMPAALAGETEQPGWRIHFYDAFFIHMAGSWPGLLTAWLTRAIDQGTYIWPHYVAWASHAWLIGFKSKHSKKRVFQEQEFQEYRMETV